MKELFDRLSIELAGKYVHYLEEFTADFDIEPEAFEFRCAFTLCSDQQRRHFKMRVPTLSGDTDGERKLIVVMIFEGMEVVIDDIITQKGAVIN